jgi:hypothetical protein
MSEADKLDAPSRYLLSRLHEPGAEVEQEVGILLRGRGSFTDNQLDELRAEGAVIHTVAGDVLSATVAPAALPDLARHDFVVAVQVSQPLRPEAPEQSAPFYDVE